MNIFTVAKTKIILGGQRFGLNIFESKAKSDIKPYFHVGNHVSHPMMTLWLRIIIIKKNLTCVGMTIPDILLRRTTSHAGQENLRTLPPNHT